MSRMSKYTQEARQVLSNAREEARRLRHRMVGTEHILLGILKIGDPMIEGIFAAQHVSTMRVNQALEFVVGRGTKAFLGEPGLGVSARSVLTGAEKEAEEGDAEMVDVEHLLLGIFHERDGVTVGVLESFGVFLDASRAQVQILQGQGRENIASNRQRSEERRV